MINMGRKVRKDFGHQEYNVPWLVRYANLIVTGLFTDVQPLWHPV